jgi:hypothetical protein
MVSRGRKLGGPKLALATKLGNAANAANADRFAANVAPIIRQVQKSGATSLRAVAAALAARGIPTARGGEWNAAHGERVQEGRGVTSEPLCRLDQTNRARRKAAGALFRGGRYINLTSPVLRTVK